jgi:mannose-6-phosphate isomerase-like protein (cupin superfamily)
MPIIQAPLAPTHEMAGARFTSLATPSRGSSDTSVWTVEISPGAPGVPHTLTREEVFVVLAGDASVRIGLEEQAAGPGDAIVVPVDTPFELTNKGAEVLRLLCCMPVDGQACVDGTTFTPPWAQ